MAASSLSPSAPLRCDRFPSFARLASPTCELLLFCGVVYRLLPFGASCEQCFLVEAGAATVIIGPGSLDQAHTVDEYVEKAQLLRAAELYRQIAMDILK